MRFMTIASGSSGNCTYIGTEKTNILLDVGVSMKNIDIALSDIGMSLSDLDAIFITHEHIDHIKGLGVVLRKYHIPVYATGGTVRGISECKSLREFDFSLLKSIRNDQSVTIGDLTVNAKSISHDANDPVCYTFVSEGKKLSYATDLGYYDEDIISFLMDADALIIEANHDIRMLEVGPYPYILKQRILGDKGHICNEASGELVSRLLNEHVKHISLAHLSDKNNYPGLALETVRQAIHQNPLSGGEKDFGLCVAPRYVAGQLVEL